MNNEFLIGAAQLNQAFGSQEPCTSGGHGRGITRRSFIKRTGGATVAILLASGLQSKASGDPGDNDHCTAGGNHGSYCTWVKEISVEFTEQQDHTAASKAQGSDWSGHIWKGTLSYITTTCTETGTKDNPPIECDVVTGGYFDSDALIMGNERDCDTPCNPGTYKVNANPGGSPWGYFFVNDPDGREYIKLHLRSANLSGTHGCIGFDYDAANSNPWKDFVKAVKGGNTGRTSCPHSSDENPIDKIPISVKFNVKDDNGVQISPYFHWKPGQPKPLK